MENGKRLTDLEILLKDKWPVVEQWRYHNKNIEFALPGIGDKLHWFPYIQAPESIARYVHSYIKTMNKVELE